MDLEIQYLLYMVPESMQVARFKAALALLRSCCKNGVYLPSIPSILPTLKDGNPDFDVILVIDKESLQFLEGVVCVQRNFCLCYTK